MNKIVERATAPTPKFFKVLRTIGLVLATVGTAVLTAPVALPVIVTTVGGYVAVAGGIISAAIDGEKCALKIAESLGV